MIGIVIKGMDIPETYHQILEQEPESNSLKYYHCYVCKCSIPIVDGRLGCELHPQCGCNIDVFFHKLFN